MPQRFLRPGLTNSERFNKVSLHAQSLWIRILTRVDDFGRYDARSSVLAGELFSVWNELHPEDVVNPQRIPALRSELQAAGLAEFYTSEGKEVVQLLQWEERARAEKSKWPNPNGSAADSCAPQRNPASLASTSSPSPSGGPGRSISEKEGLSSSERVSLDKSLGRAFERLEHLRRLGPHKEGSKQYEELRRLRDKDIPDLRARLGVPI